MEAFWTLCWVSTVNFLFRGINNKQITIGFDPVYGLHLVDEKLPTLPSRSSMAPAFTRLSSSKDFSYMILLPQ